MRGGPCSHGFIALVEQNAGTRPVHQTLKSRKHHTLLIAETGGIHIKSINPLFRSREAGKKPVFGPIDLIVFKNAVTVGGNFMADVLESYFRDFAGIGSGDFTVGMLGEHRHLLCCAAEGEKRCGCE